MNPDTLVVENHAEPINIPGLGRWVSNVSRRSKEYEISIKGRNIGPVVVLREFVCCDYGDMVGTYIAPENWEAWVLGLNPYSYGRVGPSIFGDDKS